VQRLGQRPDQGAAEIDVEQRAVEPFGRGQRLGIVERIGRADDFGAAGRDQIGDVERNQRLVFDDEDAFPRELELRHRRPRFPDRRPT
jgi:hypothetical protein